MAPTPTIMRQDRSAAIRQAVSHCVSSLMLMYASLKATVVMRATTDDMSRPKPCMEKTAAIMAPRQRVGANLRHVSIKLPAETRYNSLRSNDG